MSGGCVEGAVYELCQEALETRAPSSSASGYSADDAFAVGRRPRTLADPRLRPAPPALTSRGAGGLGRSGSGGDVSPGAVRACVLARDIGARGQGYGAHVFPCKRVPGPGLERFRSSREQITIVLDHRFNWGSASGWWLLTHP
ncbi:hypothetical protein [Streptomyces sp. NBC_01602]|uniref:hypothetical protein n=1 Tax=Streptomyces sp. NBC_01602 TaxID=2975893 RepID=UPI003866030A